MDGAIEEDIGIEIIIMIIMTITTIIITNIIAIMDMVVEVIIDKKLKILKRIVIFIFKI
jgi:hypothetical protein